MHPNDYQQLASRTECNQTVARNRYRTLVQQNPLPIRLNHAVIGLTGEVGELATALEHWLHYQKDLDVPNIVEELGDCLWYIALACNALGLSLDEIMEANIAKLKVRYPEKFEVEQAIESNRDRPAEHEVFEEVASAQEQAQDQYRSIVCASCCEGSGVESEEKSRNHYNRLCSKCKHNQIHNNNKSGLCPDCYAEEHPQA